jgi:Protein of unknown function (DUF3147)
VNGELVARFVLGGLLVSAFAILGDLFRPKSLAGIFGAAPSVALATLGLTLATKGADYASTELRSMVFGAVALGCYGLVIGLLLLRGARPTLGVTAGGLLIWFGAAGGLWALFLAG